MSNGEKIEITKENYRIIKQLSKSIGNIEIIQKITEKEEIKEIKKQREEEIEDKIEKEIGIERIIEELEKKERGIIRKKKIEFASKHFYEISKEEIEKLDNETIFEIVSNEYLLIEDEDSLFEIIKEIQVKHESKAENRTGNEERRKHKQEEKFENYGKNRIKTIDFYEKIEFEGLSENKFKEFLEIFDINDMTNCLWYKLCRCFQFNQKDDMRQRIETLRSERYYQKEKSQKIEPKANNRFDGIINHLTKKNGGNIVDKGIIEVVGSSVYYDHIPENSIELYNKNNYFQSTNIKDSWLCYDFKERKVCPTHYSIRSHVCGKGGNHLQSWVIEGTNEETEYAKKGWEIIDEKKKEPSLDDQNAENTFEIKKQENKFYRYLRIRITDVETRGYYLLTLSALEYFGQIK